MTSEKKKSTLLRDAVSVFQALLPLADRFFGIVPVNPVIRADMWVISIVGGAVAGLGGFRTARVTSRGILIGWFSLAAAAALICVEVAFARNVRFGLSPESAAVAARWAYLLLVIFLGISTGAFWGSRGREDEDRARTPPTDEN